jgi:hypothetical protein
MELEPDTQITVYLNEDYPFEDVVATGAMLEDQGFFVPGFIPPTQWLRNPSYFIYAESTDVEIYILPDRNIVSRLASAVQGNPVDPQTRHAAAIMAFAHFTHIQFEPSISYHEYAPSHTNELAIEELKWFRVADNADPFEWIEVALGRKDAYKPFSLPTVETPPLLNLAKPLRRWGLNYIAVLKIAELELTVPSSFDRIMKLLDWMLDDFFLAGPAFLWACVYFAPNSPPKKGFIKNIKAADREKAIKGIRNATWDVTHLSDFIARVQRPPKADTRFILASLDVGLRTVAHMLLQKESFSELAENLSRWWPERQARQICERYEDYVGRVRSVSPADREERPASELDDFTARGEAFIRSWR